MGLFPEADEDQLNLIDDWIRGHAYSPDRWILGGERLTTPQVSGVTSQLSSTRGSRSILR
jgi:hypothetical protein